MLPHEQLETLQPIINSSVCLCEKTISYKYQVVIIVFYSFCLQLQY